MTTGIPSGLGVTAGWAKEVTVGTFVTPARWLPHLKVTAKYKKKPVQGEVLRGSRALLGSRRAIVSHTVDTSVEFTTVDRQLGIFFQNMLGCQSPLNTEIGSTGVYTQTHTFGTPTGLSLSLQKGIPRIPGGVVVPLSYNGLKVVSWQLEVARDQIGKFTASLDGWNETTATSYTAATYLTGASAPNVLTFAEGSLLIGGTVTTTTGITSVATNAAPVGVVSSVTVKGENKLDVERFPLGSTTKKEQVPNGFGMISGEVEIEFATVADFYTAFHGDTPLALQFKLLGPKIGTSGTNHSFITVILPQIRWEGETPNESGANVIKVKVPFTALTDGLGDPLCQVQYQTLTTTV
jgi:hypothetical protein